MQQIKQILLSRINDINVLSNLLEGKDSRNSTLQAKANSTIASAKKQQKVRSNQEIDFLVSLNSTTFQNQKQIQQFYFLSVEIFQAYDSSFCRYGDRFEYFSVKMQENLKKIYEMFFAKHGQHKERKKNIPDALKKDITSLSPSFFLSWIKKWSKGLFSQIYSQLTCSQKPKTTSRQRKNSSSYHNHHHCQQQQMKLKKQIKTQMFKQKQATTAAIQKSPYQQSAQFTTGGTSFPKILNCCNSSSKRLLSSVALIPHSTVIQSNPVSIINNKQFQQHPNPNQHPSTTCTIFLQSKQNVYSYCAEQLKTYYKSFSNIIQDLDISHTRSIKRLGKRQEILNKANIKQVVEVLLNSKNKDIQKSIVQYELQYKSFLQNNPQQKFIINGSVNGINLFNKQHIQQKQQQHIQQETKSPSLLLLPTRKNISYRIKKSLNIDNNHSYSHSRHHQHQNSSPTQLNKDIDVDVDDDDKKDNNDGYTDQQNTDDDRIKCSKFIYTQPPQSCTQIYKINTQKLKQFKRQTNKIKINASQIIFPKQFQQQHRHRHRQQQQRKSNKTLKNRYKNDDKFIICKNGKKNGKKKQKSQKKLENLINHHHHNHNKDSIINGIDYVKNNKSNRQQKSIYYLKEEQQVQQQYSKQYIDNNIYYHDSQRCLSTELTNNNNNNNNNNNDYFVQLPRIKNSIKINNNQKNNIINNRNNINNNSASASNVKGIIGNDASNVKGNTSSSTTQITGVIGGKLIQNHYPYAHFPYKKYSYRDFNNNNNLNNSNNLNNLNNLNNQNNQSQQLNNIKRINNNKTSIKSQKQIINRQTLTCTSMIEINNKLNKNINMNMNVNLNKLNKNNNKEFIYNNNNKIKQQNNYNTHEEEEVDKHYEFIKVSTSVNDKDKKYIYINSNNHSPTNLLYSQNKKQRIQQQLKSIVNHEKLLKTKQQHKASTQKQPINGDGQTLDKPSNRMSFKKLLKVQQKCNKQNNINKMFQIQSNHITKIQQQPQQPQQKRQQQNEQQQQKYRISKIITKIQNNNKQQQQQRQQQQQQNKQDVSNLMMMNNKIKQKKVFQNEECNNRGKQLLKILVHKNLLN